MKKVFLFLSFALFTGSLLAQKLTTTAAVVAFDATTPKDALPKAENKTVIGSLDKATGALKFEAAVNNFAFSNPKIQEHFNGEKWLNSSVHSKFTFTGTIEKFNKVKLNKDGVYNVSAKGDLTVKGISKPVKAAGTITVTGGKISAVANFSIKLKDYNITGQSIEAGKVAEEPKITVSANF